MITTITGFPVFQKQSVWPFLLLLLFFSANSVPAQSALLTSEKSDALLIVHQRKVILVRPPEVVRQFPSRRTATVTYPEVGGLSNPAVMARVRSILRFKNIFDYSLSEYREDAWLSEFSYKISYNANYIFDITFTQSGVAAYPDTQTRHFAIDLTSGEIIKADQVFVISKLDSLAALVDNKLQDEIKRIIQAIKADPGLDRDQANSLPEAFDGMKYTVENLQDFSVGATGITFLYDAGLPHVVAAFEPRGRYFFPYSELKTYIKPDGLLGQFIR